jgi:hypothetical protein
LSRNLWCWPTASPLDWFPSSAHARHRRAKRDRSLRLSSSLWRRLQQDKSGTGLRCTIPSTLYAGPARLHRFPTHAPARLPICRPRAVTLRPVSGEKPSENVSVAPRLPEAPDPPIYFGVWAQTHQLVFALALPVQAVQSFQSSKQQVVQIQRQVTQQKSRGSVGEGTHSGTRAGGSVPTIDEKKPAHDGGRNPYQWRHGGDEISINPYLDAAQPYFCCS